MDLLYCMYYYNTGIIANQGLRSSNTDPGSRLLFQQFTTLIRSIFLTNCMRMPKEHDPFAVVGNVLRLRCSQYVVVSDNPTQEAAG